MSENTTNAPASADPQAAAVQDVAAPEVVQQHDEPAPEPVAKAQEEDASSASVYVPHKVKRQNIEGDPVNEPLVVAATDVGPSVTLPTANEATLMAGQQALPDNFEPDERWAAVMEGGNTLSTDGEYEAALEGVDRNWRRVMSHNNKRIGTQNLTTPSVSGQEVSGDAALMAYRSHSRSSAGANIFFWGSGLNVKFNALPNETLYHLSRELSSSRITAGRATYAVALSQHMVYTAEAILEVANSARFKSSVQPAVDLGDVIRITDFNTLVWGLAVATFPHGFDIERGCIAKPGVCQHTTKARVNVRRMQVVDDATLSEGQRTWMAGLQDGKHSAEDVKAYQDMFARVPTRDYTIEHENGQTTVITLKVPTVNEFIAAGKLWIDDVNRAVVQAIGEQASFAERNNMMQELMQVANARQYSHWVESVNFGGGKITAVDTIRRVLAEEISGDNMQLDAFIKAVRDFNEKIATSVVVVNNYKCPACQKYQMVNEGTEAEDEQPPTYIPVEVVSTFFALIYQKLSLK